MRPSTYDVAIIGLGFTGSALAVELLPRLAAGSRVLLVGSPGETGRGLAYSTDNPDHLLNVRAERMSMIAGDASHFTRWLRERGGRGDATPAALAAEYAPRALYGSYIRETLGHAVGDARCRLTVDIVEETAADLRDDGGGYLVETGASVRYRAALVALCLGNGSTDLPIPTDRIALAAEPRVIRQPFRNPCLAGIGRDDRVLLVGTGLTMVDQVLTLLRQGHAGEMFAISRHGLLPVAHAGKLVTPHPIGWPDRDITLRRLVRRVAAEARALGAADGNWRAVMDGLRPLTQSLWQRLSPDDRRRFARHVESLWSIHRHRMPPAAAERIASLRDAGRLTAIAGKVTAIRSGGCGLVVEWRPRGAAAARSHACDWVINASGFCRDAPGFLLASLYATRLARPDRGRRGLDVAADGSLLSRNGTPTRGLFAAGPLTAGRFFEITAVPEIRVQVAALSETLAAAVDQPFVATGRERAITPRRPAGHAME